MNEDTIYRPLFDRIVENWSKSRLPRQYYSTKHSRSFKLHHHTPTSISRSRKRTNIYLSPSKAPKKQWMFTSKWNEHTTTNCLCTFQIRRVSCFSSVFLKHLHFVHSVRRSNMMDGEDKQLAWEKKKRSNNNWRTISICSGRNIRSLSSVRASPC